MAELEKQFETAMFDIYRRARTEARYSATMFLQMLKTRGAIGTAKFLINAERQSDGFTNLQLAGRLDLTVEAMVVEETRWHRLFDATEIEKARHRLEQNHYEFGSRA